jgi:hypothetical protein
VYDLLAASSFSALSPREQVQVLEAELKRKDEIIQVRAPKNQKKKNAEFNIAVLSQLI